MRGVIILMGPSGTLVKDVANTLVKELNMVKVVSHTTRPIRDGEVNGVDYNFVTVEELPSLRFIESEELTDGIYGHTVEAFEKVLKKDSIGIVVVDPAGAINIAKYLESFMKENNILIPTMIVNLNIPEDIRRDRLLKVMDKDAAEKRLSRKDGIITPEQTKEMLEVVDRFQPIIMVEIDPMYYGIIDQIDIGKAVGILVFDPNLENNVFRVVR